MRQLHASRRFARRECRRRECRREYGTWPSRSSGTRAACYDAGRSSSGSNRGATASRWPGSTDSSTRPAGPVGPKRPRKGSGFSVRPREPGAGAMPRGGAPSSGVPSPRTGKTRDRTTTPSDPRSKSCRGCRARRRSASTGARRPTRCPAHPARPRGVDARAEERRAVRRRQLRALDPGRVVDRPDPRRIRDEHLAEPMELLVKVAEPAELEVGTEGTDLGPGEAESEGGGDDQNGPHPDQPILERESHRCGGSVAGASGTGYAPVSSHGSTRMRRPR